MLIKYLQLLNFRNYSKLDLNFENRPTIFLGSNGAGKSNILEAIYLLSTSKSPRVEEEVELIKKGNEAATVKGEIEQDGETNELMVTMVGDPSFAGTSSGIKRFGKRVAVNGVPKRAIDFIGTLPTVIFWPSDINMVTGSPALRRWHLDLALAQTSTSYKKALTLYEQVLTSRNRVLRRINEGQGRIDELTYWTDELIKEGKAVSVKRKEFFEYINSHTNPLGDFVFEYKPNELSYERLEQYKDRELAAMNTLIGPHRDDFEILLNESKDKRVVSVEGLTSDSSDTLDTFDSLLTRDMSKYGSRGEQRMSTLAFKMAQLEFMSHALGKRPVLLLDDVFSELDEEHRAVVANISLMQQTIIATVELENIPQEFLDKARIIKVDSGQIKANDR